MTTARSRLRVVYPLSIVCPQCHGRAWRVFSLYWRPSEFRIPYRCSRGHDSSIEAKRDEHSRTQGAAAVSEVGAISGREEPQIRLL